MHSERGINSLGVSPILFVTLFTIRQYRFTPGSLYAPAIGVRVLRSIRTPEIPIPWYEMPNGSYVINVFYHAFFFETIPSPTTLALADDDPGESSISVAALCVDLFLGSR